MTSRGGGLEGRAVLLTGASRGIGRALALAFADRGARVCLAARSADGLEQVAASIRDAGGEAVTCPGDVADPADAERMVSTAAEAFGGLDTLVNNAGVAREGTILEQSLGDWNTVIGTNLNGVFLCTRAAARVMSETGGGKVLNIASVFGVKPVRSFAAYCASKAAILQFTRVAAVELARHGIQVNAIAPGYVETDLNREALSNPALRERIIKRIPAGRISHAEELVPVAAFLCSPESDYITGETVVIDGGFALQ